MHSKYYLDPDNPDNKPIYYTNIENILDNLLKEYIKEETNNIIKNINVLQEYLEKKND